MTRITAGSGRCHRQNATALSVLAPGCGGRPAGSGCRGPTRSSTVGAGRLCDSKLLPAGLRHCVVSVSELRWPSVGPRILPSERLFDASLQVGKHRRLDDQRLRSRCCSPGGRWVQHDRIQLPPQMPQFNQRSEFNARLGPFDPEARNEAKSRCSIVVLSLERIKLTSSPHVRTAFTI